jgi:hypothetical protein
MGERRRLAARRTAIAATHDRIQQEGIHRIAGFAEIWS